MISNKINNRFTPPTPGKLRLSGKIADQMETFFRERVTSDYARDVILAECEEQFRLRNDDETIVGYWRGEFWGKWVISALPCRKVRAGREAERDAAQNGAQPDRDRRPGRLHRHLPR